MGNQFGESGDGAERLREYLRVAGLHPGDRLPGERDLAVAVGLGRGALRPALEQLAAEGVIDRRPQSGTFLVAVPAPAPAASGAKVWLIAPFRGTGEPGRESDPGWLSRVANAFERTAVADGLVLSVRDQTDHAGDPCSVKALAREAAAGAAAAVVLLHPLGTRKVVAHALSLLHDARVHPVIASSRTYPGLASQVYFDSEWGAYVAVRRLLLAGHRRIGFVGGPHAHEWVQARLRGYHGALEASDEIDVEFGEWAWLPGTDEERLAVPDDGAAGFAAWAALPADARPTALFCANDTVALGLLAAAKAAGVAVPADLSVIGFDNDAGALLAALTTVERPAEALGEAVARITLERIQAGPDGATVTHRLRPVVIERATVSRPKEG